MSGPFNPSFNARSPTSSALPGAMKAAYQQGKANTYQSVAGD
mgnify:CR=1 FL=1